ncbi:MAG: hypothetical protein VB049_06775 [Candidatus Pelethousia sp.]|nr:hypothetical protein [Candidatus Pelethousia sp.]
MKHTKERTLEVAMACLLAICADEEARDADRIGAAKLLLDSMGREGPETITVVMEGIPKEYLA